MLADKFFLKCQMNDQIKKGKIKDYQNLFPNEQEVNENHYYNIQNNYIRFTYRNFTFQETVGIDQNLISFNRFYQISNIYNQHSQLHYSLKFASQSIILYTSQTQINSFNIITGQKKKIINASNPKFLDYSNQNQLIATNNGERALIYNIKNKQLANNLQFYQDDDVLGRMVFIEQKNGKEILAVVGNDKVCHFWNPESEQIQFSLTAKTNVNDLSYNKNKSLFYLAMDSKDIWAIDQRSNVHLEFKGHQQNNFAIINIDDNIFASSGEDGQLIIWDNRTLKELNRFQFKYSIYALKYDQKNKLIFAVSNLFDINIIKNEEPFIKKETINFLGNLSSLDYESSSQKIAVGVFGIGPGISLFNVNQFNQLFFYFVFIQRIKEFRHID